MDSFNSQFIPKIISFRNITNVAFLMYNVPNPCNRRATCTSGVQLSHVGACTDLSIVEKKSDCPKQCDIDEEDGDEVVCGSDGNVYRSGRGHSLPPHVFVYNF